MPAARHDDARAHGPARISNSPPSRRIASRLGLSSEASGVNLSEIACTAPSRNAQFVSVFHDVAHARARYGRHAETVINSHRSRMLLPGVADLDTQGYFSGLVGDQPVRMRLERLDKEAKSSAKRQRAARSPQLRTSASYPIVTRSCSTVACRRRSCDCGCGSTISA